MLRYLYKTNQSTCHHKYFQLNIYSIIIHNSQKWKQLTCASVGENGLSLNVYQLVKDKHLAQENVLPQ